MAFGELVVRPGVEGRVRHRPQEHLTPEARRAPVFGHQGDDGGHVSADTVANDRQSPAIDPDLLAMGGDPRGRCIGLIDGNRVSSLGRAIVLDEDGGRARSRDEVTHETFVRRKVPEHPASAVEEHERRQRARHAGWAYDHELHALALTADRPLGNVRPREVDLDARLETLQCLPRLPRSSTGYSPAPRALLPESFAPSPCRRRPRGISETPECSAGLRDFRLDGSSRCGSFECWRPIVR